MSNPNNQQQGPELQEIDTPARPQDETPEEATFDEKQATKRKLLRMNPAKAVIGGVSQGALAVRGGINQGTQAVRGGINQGTQAVRGGISQVEKGVNVVGGTLTKVPGVSHGVSFFNDYRKFMDRGNVIDLAVAVVIGAAFTAIVTSLVNDIITPILALASGKNLEENFIILRRDESIQTQEWPTRAAAQKDSALTWNWGNFLQTVINFFIVSACIFILVKVYEMGRMNKTDASEKKCDYCLKSVPLEAVRCPECTTWLDWDACARTSNMERIAVAAANVAMNANMATATQQTTGGPFALYPPPADSSPQPLPAHF